MRNLYAALYRGVPRLYCTNSVGGSLFSITCEALFLCSPLGDDITLKSSDLRHEIMLLLLFFKLWADNKEPVVTICLLKCMLDREPGSEDGNSLVAKSCLLLGPPCAVTCQVPLSM